MSICYYNINIMVSTYFKLGIISVMVISGAIDVITYKFQNSQYLHEGPVYKLFFHPYIQVNCPSS